MTTPLIIVALLVIPWLAGYLYHSVWQREFDTRIGGLVGLSIAFMFFGVGHFVRTEPMTEMLPPWLPLRLAAVYVTGCLEWLLAAGLLIPRLRVAVGWLCIACLVVFLPVNIYAAVNAVGMGGHLWGPVYLLIRIPLQLILIAWSYWFAARK